MMLNGCEAPKVDSVKTQKSLVWLDKYYKDYPIGGNWYVNKILSDKNGPVLE